MFASLISSTVLDLSTIANEAEPRLSPERRRQSFAKFKLLRLESRNEQPRRRTRLEGRFATTAPPRRLTSSASTSVASKCAR